ncbi:MAG: sigma-54 dependent transcriptional regulator [Alphaproteobacteria bacterium]|nr:sigma-54 dependent transcriptional regulator [Alphaproteobacteria bacterium]
MAHDILIVDDEADIRMLMTGILQDEGFATREAHDATSALAAVGARQPSLVLLDIWLQGSDMDGMEILRALHRDHPGVPVVMISGHGNIETAVTAIKQGAHDFIEKPFKATQLLLVVERAIESARLRRENEELRMRAGQEDELLGDSPAITQVRQAVERVAPTGSRVLITGPAGSGKEVAARLLHARSKRAAGPFVVVNCATMIPNRMEVELFGTESTGESGNGVARVGTFERAHGGTLLLDEVADMPLETQAKIVRVLQEQTFERVGGSKKVEVDVRVVATTNKNLPKEIEGGRFREDLYYRLSVVPIRMPSLRERRGDIAKLACYYMEKAAQFAGLPPRQLAEDAVAALEAYEWPGNVRQLRNVMDWLLIMAGGDPKDPVGADRLPPEIAEGPGNLDGRKGENLMSLPLRSAREAFERAYLIAQIERFGGNISRTAAFIGMERSALHRKLKGLGVTSDERVHDA